MSGSRRFDRHDPELNTAAERCVNGLRYGADAVRPAWAWIHSAFKDGARWQHDREHAEPQTGAELIAAERKRQIEVEGWTPEHDDQHAANGYYDRPSLPQAAAIYAVTAYQGERASVGCQSPGWPWAIEWFKPGTPIRMLVKAGALIAAEIDRRLRAGEKADA